MASWTLTLKQKSRYGWEDFTITADSAAPLNQIVDILKASDVNTGTMKYQITSEYDFISGDENDDVDE